MGLSPQLNRVVITQFVRLLYPVRLSMTRFRVNGEIVPLGAFSWSDKSPRRLKSRLTLTWTCSRNFIVQFPNVIKKPVFWFGIGLQGKKKAISLTQRSKYDPAFCMQERINNSMKNKKSLNNKPFSSFSYLCLKTSLCTKLSNGNDIFLHVHCFANHTHFQMASCSPGLVLIQRRKVTREWLIRKSRKMVKDWLHATFLSLCIPLPPKSTKKTLKAEKICFQSGKKSIS